MTAIGFGTTPQHDTYDVIIIGGAIMGASTAWFLTDNADFDGRVLVVERDSNYEFCSTSHTNSCMRQQFSAELNVRISQFAADFVNNIRDHMGGDDRVPNLGVQSFGYMYLADTEDFADVLRSNLKVQHDCGAATQLMTPDQIKAKYPFYNVDDIVLGSINLINEGYWDGAAVNDWWRRQSRERGVEYNAEDHADAIFAAADAPDRTDPAQVRYGGVFAKTELGQSGLAFMNATDEKADT